MKTIAMTALLLLGAPVALSARPAGAEASASPRAKEDFRARARQELDEWGRRIDALAARARQESALVRARIEADVKALRADKRDAEQELAKLEAAGAAARKDASERVETALRRLRAAYKKAVAAPEKKKEGA